MERIGIEARSTSRLWREVALCLTMSSDDDVGGGFDGGLSIGGGSSHLRT